MDESVKLESTIEYIRDIPKLFNRILSDLYLKIHSLSTEELFRVIEERYKNDSHFYINKHVLWDISNTPNNYTNSVDWDEEICRFAKEEILLRCTKSFGNNILKEKLISKTEEIIASCLYEEQLNKNDCVFSILKKYNAFTHDNLQQLYECLKFRYAIDLIYDKLSPSCRTLPSKYGIEIIRIFPSLKERVCSTFISIKNYCEKHPDETNIQAESREEWFKSNVIPKVRTYLLVHTDITLLNINHTFSFFKSVHPLPLQEKIDANITTEELYGAFFSEPIRQETDAICRDIDEKSKSSFKYYDYFSSHYRSDYIDYCNDLDLVTCGNEQRLTDIAIKPYKEKIEKLEETLAEYSNELMYLLDKIIEKNFDCFKASSIKEEIHNEYSSYSEISRIRYGLKCLENDLGWESLNHYLSLRDISNNHLSDDNISENTEGN